ncbi:MULTISPECIES: ArsR/SmtB family transcription factor [unclassified Streptomyces]|uniref:ArsR/SmtB family transcription factor n=1 Tax=unclassified Streptomyces TaxID=2593676 RepID=UPI002E2B6E83|nr:metalloregulator ArsR/SmtB family transcription factor [Streptomyces sp. NBC_00223]
MVTSADSDVLRVLADPLRSRIVALLAEEALCVCHLVEETGAKQTNLSNHLKALREVGLVETEPCGRFVYYKLLPAAIEALADRMARIAESGRKTAESGRRRPCP